MQRRDKFIAMLLVLWLLPAVALGHKLYIVEEPTTTVTPPTDARAKRGDEVMNGGSATLITREQFIKGEDAAIPEPSKLYKRSVYSLDENSEEDSTVGSATQAKEAVTDAVEVENLRIASSIFHLGFYPRDEADNTKNTDGVEGSGDGAEHEGGISVNDNDEMAPEAARKKREGSDDEQDEFEEPREKQHVRIWCLSKACKAQQAQAQAQYEESQAQSGEIPVEGDGGIDELYSDVEMRKKREIIKGSGNLSAREPTTRQTRQTEAKSVVLGSEQPVLGNETPVLSVQAAKLRPDDESNSEDRRHRPSPPRPQPTCANVECIRGTQCIIENGRPACKSFPVPSEPSEPQRTCRDINCPRGSRCRMERDPRCRGRDCFETPVCVREEEVSCRNVQCPSGTRCTLVEDPGCRGFHCREVATCVNPCEGIRCPFGSACKFDGRDAICSVIAINPCLNARCPRGFECRFVQGQAQCFGVTSPVPTTPAPSTCPGQNEEFAQCATFCEPNCVEKNPACILACATPRCQCANGFYRNQQGVCVLAEQCEFTPSCSLNESFNQCSTLCEPRCGQPVNIACPAACGPAKCQCNQGFWRHPSGACVQQNQCFFG